jgi:hypothetical protein
MASDVKYLRGTQEQYDRYVELNKIEPMHFYYIDQQKLYLGYLELTNQTDINNAIVSLKAELVDTYAAKTDLVTLDKRIFQLEDQIYTLTQRVHGLDNSVINLELKVYEDEEKITNLESNIVTLKNISLGIGGENEPPTILAAIDNAKNDVISYVDNALSWQTIE